jgi:MFS family permease
VTTTVAPANRALRHWRNAVLAIFGLCGFLFASWVSRISNVRDVLHASTEQMGLLILGVAVGAAFGLAAASHVVARIGTTRTITWGYCVGPIGVLGVALMTTFTPSFAGIFACLVVFGAANSITDVAMNVSGAGNEQAIGRNLMPLFHAAFSLGTVLGAAVGALAQFVGVPLGVHLSGVGLLTIGGTLVLVRYLQEPSGTGSDAASGTGTDAAGGHDGRTPGWRGRLAVWGEPRVLLIGLIVLGMTFAEGSANDWLSLAMIDGHGVANASGAAIFGVFVAAMTVGRVAGAPLLDRFGRVLVLRASAVSAAIGLLMVIIVPSTAGAIAGVVLWGLGAALGFPVGMSAAADDPKNAAARVSAVAAIGYGAFLIGPPVIGLIGQRIGLLHALAVVLVLVALAGLCSSAARKPVAAAAADTTVPLPAAVE